MLHTIQYPESTGMHRHIINQHLTKFGFSDDSNQGHGKKRTSATQIELEEQPALKKQKFNNLNKNSVVLSINKNDKNKKNDKLCRIRFPHFLDNKEFEQLFHIIDNCTIIKSLNISHSISGEIAQFSIGKFKMCGNDICGNDISILYSHEETYANNHNNYMKIGYKWCASDRLFCSECMYLAKPCQCYLCNQALKESLIFLPNKCELCETSMSYNDGANDCDNENWICSQCKLKCCNNCNQVRWCLECDAEFCYKCSVIPNTSIMDDDLSSCICNQCYDKIVCCETTCNINYYKDRQFEKYISTIVEI